MGSLEGAWVYLCSEETGPDECGHSFPHRALSFQWLNISSFWLWLIILLLHEKKDSLKIVQLISSSSKQERGFLVSVLLNPSLLSSFIASTNGSTSPLTFPLSMPPVLFLSLNRVLHPTHTHTHKLVRIESSLACRWLCLLKEYFFHNLPVL